MRRITTIVLVLMLVFSMGLFAGGQQEAEEGEYPGHPQDEPFKGAVDMGYVPFAFTDESGEVKGFAVDMAEALAEELGRPGAEIEDVQWSGIFSALFTEKIECIFAPTNITEERAKEMDFTEGYMDAALIVLINSEDSDSIDSIEDLEGMVIGANTGSIAHKWLNDNQDKYGYEIDQYDRAPDAHQAVQVGRIDASIDDLAAGAEYAQDKDSLSTGDIIPTGEKYGIPFRKGDEYRAVVEEALENIKEDGTLAEIHEKWFGTEPADDSPVVNPQPGIGEKGFEGYIEP
ncbi:MAG: ABC transporter substrate-binding protein [Sediminispirochaetaceae bacterium]